MELRVWGLGLTGRMGCETVSVVWFPFSGNGDVGYHGNLALLLQPLLLRRPLILFRQEAGVVEVATKGKQTSIIFPATWVAVKELKVSYYTGETLLFTTYTHYGNLI